MLDPDIQGRLEALEREHLNALFDYMLGPDRGEAQGGVEAMTLGARHDRQTKTPGSHRGTFASRASDH